MGSVLIAVITGAIIGWIGSVVMRTDSQAGILGDIGLGSFCGLVATVALSQGFLLDAFLTAALAAMLVSGTLAILRRSEERRSRS